jgi:hypothetical protein
MNFETSVDIDLNDLAYELSKDGSMTSNNYDKLIEFVLAVDDHVCDLQFTKALVARLNGVIEECES